MALVNKGGRQVWEPVAATITLSGMNFGTTSSDIQAGFDDTICSKVQWVDNEHVRCTLTTPTRDGFEDRTPWIIVGGQQSYASSKPGREIEYQVIGYKKYSGFTLIGKHLFVAEGLDMKQCQTRCDEDKDCKGVSRKSGLSSDKGSKCEGWTLTSISTCVASLELDVFLHETVRTTEIGTCHSMDTMRFGPSVSSINKGDHANPNGGDLVLIDGFNFGLPGSPKAATTVGFVDGFPCLKTTVLSDTRLECTLPPNEMSGPNVLVLRETFDSYNDGRSVPLKLSGNGNTDDHELGGLNPMFFDIIGSTGGISDQCGSVASPGGSWVTPPKGVKMLETQPLFNPFGGTLSFSVKVGRGDNCNLPATTAQLKQSFLEVQYSVDGGNLGKGTWQSLRKWSLTGSAPRLSSNEWHLLTAEMSPSSTGSIVLRFIQSDGSPSSPSLLAFDDIKMMSRGGPVNLAVEVDGTRSAAAPSGTDFAGKTAPNSVTVQYLSDGMDSSGLVVSSVSSSGDIDLGGFVGYGQRHLQCTRNFESKGINKLMEDCEFACLKREECTMFSWGSPGRNSQYNPDPKKNKGGGEYQPTECRISINKKNGCSPEVTNTNMNPINDALPNVPTLYVMGTKEERAHGAFGTRDASHALQPLTGGIFVTRKGAFLIYIFFYFLIILFYEISIFIFWK